MTDYEKQGADFLAKHGIEFSFILIGSGCPRFCKDAENNKDMDKINAYPRKTHIHGKHYRITFSRKATPGKTYSLDYWNSYNDEEFNYYKANRLGLSGGWSSTRKDYWSKHDRNRTQPLQRPTPYSVLCCVTRCDPGTFEDFVGEYGYDTASRKAETTWKAVREDWNKARLFFTPLELEEMQEIS
jgi:hypothetical protein